MGFTFPKTSLRARFLVLVEAVAQGFVLLLEAFDLLAQLLEVRRRGSGLGCLAADVFGRLLREGTYAVGRIVARDLVQRREQGRGCRAEVAQGHRAAETENLIIALEHAG